MHASPFCLQNDVAVLQTPPMHPFEQHSAFDVHVLPDALQAPPLADAQMPPAHLPLQQSAFTPHVAPSFLHVLAVHRPVALQLPEQHCVSLWHVAVEPVGMHGPLMLPHWFGVWRPHCWPVGQSGVATPPTTSPHA
jgi:hypothetical protein